MILFMEKCPKKVDKFTGTEVGTLIEAIRSEFKPYLEIIPGIQEKLNATFEQAGKNTEDMQLIKFTLKKHGELLNEHTRILNEHGRTLNEHSGLLNKHSELLNRILEELKSKVGRKEFELLEKKAASLAR